MGLINPDQIRVQNNASDTGLRPIINFQPGTNITFTIVDDPANSRVNILINASSALTGSGTDNTITRWDGTSAIQGSGVTLDDSNNITGVNSLTVSSLTIGTLSGVLKASAGVVSGSATTTDLPEGTNLYYTSARFDTAFAGKTTTDLAEGTNLYYTNARFDTRFATKTTTDLAEGTNLYFTDERAQDAVGAMVANSTKVSLTYVDGAPSLTADIIAGSLVNADISASAAIAYSKLNLTGSIVDADISASAAIARSKIATGTADHVVINSGTGALSSEANLAVSRGGTGTGTLTANNLIVGNGTSAVTFIAPGTSGNILQSNGTTWASTSLSSAGIAPNNLTYMTISNESATLANSRRIAVNATNLVGTDGGAGSAYTINTIQNIDTSATPTFQRVIVTGSTNQRFFQGDGTVDGSSGTEIGYQFDWTINQTGTADAIGIKANVTNTASPNLFYLMDLQVGGTSKFKVDENGNLNMAGALTATGATLSGLTTGQIVFPASGVLTGDASLFWDNTNKRLGVGTSTPSYPFDMQGTLTSTSGNDAVEFITASTNPSGASTAAHRALDAIITYNTSSTNNLTTLAAGRFLSINNNSAGGTLTTIQGLALQTIVGPVLGAASGTAYAANINGAVFQSIQNSTTASVTATNYAGQFSADHRGSNTVTNNAAGIFTVSMTNASGTMSAGYGNWIRFSTVFGNALTAGTITNIYGLNIEGFPSGAATFSNPPHQIYLQAGSTAARAIRQLGSSNYSTFQGYVGIGSDTAPSSSYALSVTGNCTFSSTIFKFSTLTSLTFQDALARSRLYMDATSTTISTTPVSITPTANIGTGISLTTTTPAHTGLTAEQYELLIDMSSTKTWNGSLSIPTQRSLYIRAPVVNAPVTTTIDQIATVAISGVPTISGGGSVNITESIGFLMEAVSIPSNIATGIGFSISAPTTGGASTVACGRFLGGNVGINSMSPDTWLDIKVTSITSTLNNVVCLDSTTRYTGFYVGGSALASMPGSGVSSFALFDFGLAPTSSYSQNNQGHQIFFELKNANNFTGTLVGSTTSMKVNTSGGTTTTAVALDGLFTTVSGSTGAVTTGVAGRLRMTVNGTGTVTTAVGLDMTYSSANVAVTTTTGHYIRLQNPSKGAAATTTNWDSILIEDGTMTVGTRYCAIRVLGSTHHNRIVPKTKFGSDATPTRMVDINGGLAINAGTAVSLTADNQVVTVGDRSYYQISSNNATAANRTFVLTQSTTSGHILVLEWTGTNAGELVDDSAQNGGGNHRLNGTWTPTQYDTITLISNGTDWVELARSAN